ncbi:MAG: heme peroxidase family protein [Nocardioidaceae bacterium]
MAGESNAERHGRDVYFIEGEGFVGGDARLKADAVPDKAGERRRFRFTRIGPEGAKLGRPINIKVAQEMSRGTALQEGSIPAGYTYLGQLVDHDLTFDKTTVSLGDNVSPADMLSGRSPKLDLDCLYGNGPTDPRSAEFYKDDRHLKTGGTVKAGPGRLKARPGYDLPREGDDSRGNPRRALIPDHRNDENLAVAQTHCALIRFHNRVVDTLDASVPAAQRFAEARRTVVLHYQWLLKNDYLPRIVERSVVTDVFTNGRKIFDVGAAPTSMPAMPIEFSVGAFRLGHSMVRPLYDWNSEFSDGGGTLDLLFSFSGTSGFLGGGDAALPSNWIVDWRRLYPFKQIGRNDLKPPPGEFNTAMILDTKVARALDELPPGAFGGTDADLGTLRTHLAFRNLVRSGMVHLATGQQMAELLASAGVAVTPLTTDEILFGAGKGASLDSLTARERDAFVARTPLWFYVLREAELNGGKMTGVGARIVVETMHRAMEAAGASIVRQPAWRPSLGPVATRFTMMDLLLFAFEDDPVKLNPLGD